MYTSKPNFASQITIAKVDATANDVPDEISGFPTIKLFPAGKKDSPVVYEGSRTIEDLAAFIKENGKYKVDAYEGKNETEEGDISMPDAEGMGEAAKAATEKVKEKVTDKVTDKVKEKAGEATEAAKQAMADSDDAGAEEHDEL